MLVLNDRLLHVPIMSIQTGGRIARTDKLVIDPRRLQVVAFYCEGPALDIAPAILHAEDVREVSDIGLIIDSADDIMHPNDLIRLKEVLTFNFDLIGKLVVDDAGHKIGKVISFSVETAAFYIIKLHVKPGLLQSLQTAERIIDRSQIVEITSKHIVVRTPTVKEEKQSLTDSLPIIDNPFRRQQQQIDGVSGQEPL